MSSGRYHICEGMTLVKSQLYDAQAEAAALRKTEEQYAERILQQEEEIRALRKRVEELEGEARVLIGCPCLCHTGQYGEPHRDCRECVRGCTTPSAIDNDHEWALWCEKWRAQVEVTARTYSKLTEVEGRAEKAERELQRIEAKRIERQKKHARCDFKRRERMRQLQANLDAATFFADSLQARLDLHEAHDSACPCSGDGELHSYSCRDCTCGIGEEFREVLTRAEQAERELERLRNERA